MIEFKAEAFFLHLVIALRVELIKESILLVSIPFIINYYVIVIISLMNDLV